MIQKLLNYFISDDKRDQVEVYRQYRLVVSIILINALFDLNYAGITVLIGLSEGTRIMLATALIHFLQPFLLRWRFPLSQVIHFYIFVGVQAVVVCVYYSGGFTSPVLPWLASSPIVALLLGGRRIGFFWVCVNSLTVLVFGLLDGSGYDFPQHYDKSWANTFFLNCHLGLILITFVVALVFENGKNTALKKLAEQNVLLAEEKKKIALQQISQEIHDNIGQTLSLAKLNLHRMQQLQELEGNKKVAETLQLVAKAIQDLREISKNLHADNITDFNLVEVLRHALETISQVGAHQTDLRLTGDRYALPSQTEFVLYRISQEVLNNIIKHAGAQGIVVEINYEPQKFTLLIRDDGCGINSKDFMLKGQGLRNIQSRTKLIGGKLEIFTLPGEGTSVLISIPCHEPVQVKTF
ncbi:sensor histidine kinase [Cesiribacter sp. SM1]|uniref:sensor histidine kinase n=1 Tax=Cesiribacter sp. SM1 TaxID=2861196 RepID=UPI001CD7F576|nr:sensor histidine kinase [Cesiribacter sp. SM1]